MNDSTKQQELLNTLLKLAEKEKKNGNTSITQEKLNNLSSYIINSDNKKQFNKFNSYYPLPDKSLQRGTGTSPINNTHSPLFNKFTLTNDIAKPKTVKKFNKQSKFKQFENTLINILETLANILDNLHLFSKLPMFPQNLLGLLKQTNKLWVLILIFLIRKTVSQLLNLIKKEKKVKIELDIVNSSPNTKVFDNSLLKRYEKVLKDLKFDKMMLVLELIGNFLDLAFNFIELYGIPVPDWFMNLLNFSSMFMTIYRMNKDDEYVDDDITEELI